jgi:hypothetical protein
MHCEFSEHAYFFKGFGESGYDLRVVSWRKFVFGQNVYIGLVKFAESSFLRALAAIVPAYLRAFERKRELSVMLRYIACKGNSVIEPEREVSGVTGLLHAVYFFFRIPAGLRQQDFGAVNDWGFDMVEPA